MQQWNAFCTHVPSRTALAAWEPWPDCARQDRVGTDTPIHPRQPRQRLSTWRRGQHSYRSLARRV